MSEDAISTCRREFAADAATFDIQSFQEFARDGYEYDAIVFNEVLYYFPLDSLETTLQTVSSTLRAGGVWIVSMHRNPVADKWWRLLDRYVSERRAIQVVNPGSDSVWTVKLYDHRCGSTALG